MSEAQAPYVAQAVHYRSFGTPGGEHAPACRAATITALYGRAELLPSHPVALAVLNPTGLFFNEAVKHDALGKAGGTWHHLAECTEND